MVTRIGFDTYLGDFFISNPCPMWVYANEGDSFHAVNKAAIQLYGYSEAEFLELKYKDLLPHADGQKLNFNDTNEKETLTEHLKKDGTPFYVKLANYQTVFNGVNAILVTAVDFTQTRNLQSIREEKNKELEILSQVAMLTNNMVLITDDEGRINWVNNALLETMQFSLTEILSKTPSEIFHGPLSSQSTTLKIKDAIKNRLAFKEEIVHYTKDNNPVWVLADGQPIINETDQSVKYIIIENNITSYKQQEVKLNRSESELNALFNSSGSILLLFDSSLKITTFNKRAESFVKKQFDTVIQVGSSVLGIIQLIAKDTFTELALNALHGKGIENYEIKLMDKEIWWSIRFLPLFDSFGSIKGASFTAIDISDRKKAELLLIKSEERYDLVAKATFDAIWDLDILANTLYRGEGFKRLFGYQIGTLENHTSIWDDLIHPDDFKRVVTNFQMTLNSGLANWTEEYRFLKSDGNYAFVRDKAIIIRDESGKATRMVGAMQDISLQIQKEQQLKLFESAITNTTDAVVITSAQIGKSSDVGIVFVNQAFTKMTGYTLAEVLGKSPRILQGKLTDQNELNRLKNAIINWEPCEIETVNYKKNGEPFWVNISIVPVADETGQYTHWIAIQKDMTDRRNQMEERELMIKELTKNNIELKQFSYITSHNLRAPLTNMIGIFNLLDLSLVSDGRMLQLLDGLKESTFKLNETLNDIIRILIIKESVQIELTEVHFKTALTSVLNSIKNTITNSNAIIETDFSDAPSVRFSNVYMESIFFNLLTNAIKYSIPEISPLIKIRSSNSDNAVQLHISDNGLGMDWQKVKNKIFGLYQKFHNNLDTKGIGLYLVHAQVSAMGGTIELNTEVNKGSTFTITFNRNSK